MMKSTLLPDHPRPCLARAAAAFSLVEVAVSLGIAVSCLITVLALLPLGLKTSQDSVEQTEAAFLMTGLVADLKFTRELSPSPGGSPNAKTGLYELQLPWSRSSANSLPAPNVNEGDKETKFFDFNTGKLTDEMDMGSRFLVDIKYVRVNSDTKALEPILAQINIYWPPAAAASTEERENAGGVFSAMVSLPLPPFNAEL